LMNRSSSAHFQNLACLLLFKHSTKKNNEKITHKTK
jgi:hypothetical protein